MRFAAVIEMDRLAKLNKIWISRGRGFDCQIDCTNPPRHPMSKVSGYDRSRIPTRMNRKLADMVASMQGSRTLKTEAASATTKKQINRSSLCGCQCKRA